MSPGVLESRALELPQDGFFLGAEHEQHEDHETAGRSSTNSLSLDIRHSQGTTLDTTAATNTPSTNVNSVASPEQNGALDGAGSSATAGGGAKSHAHGHAQYYDHYKAGGRAHRVSHTHTLSTPTAMSDFIAMLDAQSAVQQQCKSVAYESNSDASARLHEDSGSMSPLRGGSGSGSGSGSGQFIDPNLLKNNIFMDSFALAPAAEDEISTFSSLLDDYVAADALPDDGALGGSRRPAHMHSGADHALFGGDRRHSEVITQALPELPGARGSISHAVDFWNVPDRRTAADNADSDVTQVLNDYNMNFSRAPRRASHGVQKQPRGSLSLLDGSLNNDLFSKLYKNGPAPATVKLVPWENSVFSDEDDEFALPGLEPIISPQSPKSGAGAPRPKNQQFIKPSMMLSDNASAAAKVATSGAETADLVAALDARSYDLAVDPATRYQTIKPSPVAAAIGASMGAPAAQRRRRSTPNIVTVRHAAGGAGLGAAGARGKSRSITPMSGADDEAKPFKCKECAKAFRRSEHLKRHIRSVHSTERPFACMLCEKKFSRSDNLSQHLKTHKKHGDF